MKINDGIKYVYSLDNIEENEYILISKKLLAIYYEAISKEKVLFSDTVNEIKVNDFFYDEGDTVILTPKQIDSLDNKIVFADKEISRSDFNKLIKEDSIKIKDLIKEGKEPNRAIIRQDEKGNIIESQILVPTKQKIKEINLDKVPEYFFSYQQKLIKDPLWKDMSLTKVMQNEMGEVILVGKNPYEPNKSIIFSEEYLKDRFNNLSKNQEVVTAKSKEKEEEYEIAK